MTSDGVVCTCCDSTGLRAFLSFVNLNFDISLVFLLSSLFSSFFSSSSTSTSSSSTPLHQDLDQPLIDHTLLLMFSSLFPLLILLLRPLSSVIMHCITVPNTVSQHHPRRTPPQISKVLPLELDGKEGSRRATQTQGYRACAVQSSKLIGNEAVEK